VGGGALRAYEVQLFGCQHLRKGCQWHQLLQLDVINTLMLESELGQAKFFGVILWDRFGTLVFEMVQDLVHSLELPEELVRRLQTHSRKGIKIVTAREDTHLTELGEGPPLEVELGGFGEICVLDNNPLSELVHLKNHL